jgi:hypothetical protein
LPIREIGHKPGPVTGFNKERMAMFSFLPCMTIFLCLFTFDVVASPSQISDTGKCTTHLSDRVQRDPVIYYLENRSEIGGMLRNEEVIAWKNEKYDPSFWNWLQEAKRKFSNNKSMTEVELILALNRYVGDSFNGNLSAKGLFSNPLQKLFYHHYTGVPLTPSTVSFSDGKYRIGDLLRIKCGVCRHQAVALLEILREFGFERSFYVPGKVKIYENDLLGQIVRHAWVETTTSDDRYLIVDSANKSVMEVGKENMNLRERTVERGPIKAIFSVELGEAESVENLQAIHTETLLLMEDFESLRNWNLQTTKEFIPFINRFLRIP